MRRMGGVSDDMRVLNVTGPHMSVPRGQLWCALSSKRLMASSRGVSNNVSLRGQSPILLTTPSVAEGKTTLDHNLVAPRPQMQILHIVLCATRPTSPDSEPRPTCSGMRHANTVVGCDFGDIGCIPQRLMCSFQIVGSRHLHLRSGPGSSHPFGAGRGPQEGCLTRAPA